MISEKELTAFIKSLESRLFDNYIELPNDWHLIETCDYINDEKMQYVEDRWDERDAEFYEFQSQFDNAVQAVNELCNSSDGDFAWLLTGNQLARILWACKNIQD
jgi:hypothetical protein